MKIKCNYCNAIIDEQSKNCPQCGAPLSGANRASEKQPKTIEELQAWYVDHHLPPEDVTRFFIGKDIKEPKAFGIYKNEVGDYVVYKNKSTGERAIRYQGSDEAYAVNELYQRLKAEIVDQKTRNATERPATTTTQPTKKNKGCANKGCLISGIIVTVIIALFAIFDKSAPNGYYNYNGTKYYHQGSSWYYYNAADDDWYKSPVDIDINKDNADQYRTYTHEGKSFESSSWYDSGSHYDDGDDWDNDSDWDDDDDWDSGGTDWDSDW